MRQKKRILQEKIPAEREVAELVPEGEEKREQQQIENQDTRREEEDLG